MQPNSEHILKSTTDHSNGKGTQKTRARTLHLKVTTTEPKVRKLRLNVTSETIKIPALSTNVRSEVVRLPVVAYPVAAAEEKVKSPPLSTIAKSVRTEVLKRTVVAYPRVGISRAVRSGRIIAVTGTAPLGPDGKTVAKGEAAAQGLGGVSK